MANDEAADKDEVADKDEASDEYEHGEDDVNIYFNNDYDDGMTPLTNHYIAKSIFNTPPTDDTENDQRPSKSEGDSKHIERVSLRCSGRCPCWRCTQK